MNINRIVISDKFKDSDNNFKYFIGYGDVIESLWIIILPQMTGTIHYFDDSGKNM